MAALSPAGNRNAELALEGLFAGRERFGDARHYACGTSFGGVSSTSLNARAQLPGYSRRASIADPVLSP